MPENPYGTMLTTTGPGGDWYDPCILSDYYYTYEAGSYNSQTGEWKKGLVWIGEYLSCRLTGVRKSTSRLESNGYFSAKNDNNQYYNCVLIGIAPDAFKDQRALDQIEIPETVQRIGEGAFNGCSWLESITIPDSVTYIGDFAFKMCTSLASITIPNSVSSLGQGAFQSCSNLVSINIPDSVTSISNGVFQNCSSLGSIEIQNNVTSIGEYAFDGCSSLKGITIPSSVTTIGFGAIQRCTSLTSITIPFVGHTALNQTSGSYLYRIGYIFGTSAGDVQGALPDNLEKITVNQSTSFLANQAFAYADKVKTIQIKLADSVKAFCFGRAAFYGCTALETFKLTEASEGVAPILEKLDCLSDSIFANCYYLATIVLPHTKAFAASAYEALQIQTAPVAVDLETPGLPAMLIGKGQTADYNIFLQITPPTNIAATNFSIDGLYGNVTINGQTTLKRLASMSSIKTSYEKLADHISHDTPSDFVEALSNISLVSYSPVSVLQMYYSLELTFNDGTQANVGVQTSTCSAINVLEEDEAGNYVASTRISYDTSGFLEQIDSVWRPLPLTTVQTLVARRSTGTQAYSTSTIGGSFFAYTSARLGSGTVSITAPQRLIHAFMRDTNDNKYRLNSIAFSCTTDESEVGGFAGCSSLISADYVPIDESTDLTLANYAFRKCSSLRSFSSEYITGIGYAAFQQCYSLTTVNLPDASSLTVRSRLAEVDDYQSAVGSSLAFYNCEKLQTLVLDFNGITSIGDYAFSGCEALSWGENAPYWKKLKDIGYHAFLNCSKLTALGTLNTAELQNIYFGAFQGCKFTNITVPEVHAEVDTKDNNDSRVTLKYSNFGAFFGAASYSYNSTRVPESLKTVVIVGGTDIGTNAFRECTSLEKITIPKSVTHIGENAFKDCGKLMSVYIADVAAWYAISFDNAHSNPLSQAENLYLKDTEGNYEQVTELTVPADVKSISNYAFYNYAGLTQITILPDAITIDNGAFYGCTGLTSANVPLANLAQVVSYAEKLLTLTVRTTETSVVNTDLVTSQPSGEFGYAAVTQLCIDASQCQEINEGELKAFSGLTKLTIPIIGTFYDADSSSISSLFEGADQLPQLGTVIITRGYTNIPQQAFNGFNSLTHIQFTQAEGTADNKSIGANAFTDCTALTSITFGQTSAAPISIATYSSIGNQAFANCSRYPFGELAWQDAVSIGNSAFSGCTGLTKIKIPDNEIKAGIGSYAFYKCTGLTSITIGDSIKSIGDNAFNGCIQIPEVVLPNNLETIGEGAFGGDEKLGKLVLNTSLESIGAEAFAGCPINTIQYYGLTGEKCSVGASAFTMTNAVNIKLVSNCTIKEWCRMSFTSPSPLTKNMKFLDANDNQIVQTFDILPTDSATFGNYCFWGWNVDQPLVVFEPAPEMTHTFGNGALAINGKIYYYGSKDDSCVTPGDTNPDGKPDVATVVVPNFGLNSNDKDWTTVDSTSLFLQNLSAETNITQSGITYSKFDSNLTRLDLTKTDGTIRTIVGYEVDFTGVTILVPASKIRVATGNLPGCKRTLFQTEVENTGNITLSIGLYVSISNNSDNEISVVFSDMGVDGIIHNAITGDSIQDKIDIIIDGETVQRIFASVPAGETMIIKAEKGK